MEICRKNGSFAAFLPVFNENCRIPLDEKLDFMKPNLVACNAAWRVVVVILNLLLMPRMLWRQYQCWGLGRMN